jgi:hypothetical protein
MPASAESVESGGDGWSDNRIAKHMADYHRVNCIEKKGAA